MKNLKVGQTIVIGGDSKNKDVDFGENSSYGLASGFDVRLIFMNKVLVSDLNSKRKAFIDKGSIYKTFDTNREYYKWFNNLG